MHVGVAVRSGWLSRQQALVNQYYRRRNWKPTYAIAKQLLINHLWMSCQLFSSAVFDKLRGHGGRLEMTRIQQSGISPSIFQDGH